jgi:hypothetical protein
MATINIKPDISLGVKPPATMSISDLVNTARGAQMYQREREILPEQVEQARIQTQSARTAEQQAQFTLSKDQEAGLMRLVGGYRNDHRIASGNPDQAIEAMNEIRSKAVALGIPSERVDSLMRMGNAIAVRNPQRLPQYFDNVIQSQAGPQSQLGLQTPEIVTSGGQPGLFRRGPATVGTLPLPGAAAPAPAPTGVTGEDMTRPMGVAPGQPVQGSAAQTRPIAGAPAGAAPMAAPAAPAGQMAQPETGRLPLAYPVRQAGVPFAALPQEEADRNAGGKFRDAVVQRQSELTTARRNLQEVVKTAEKLEAESLLPETGPIGALKRGFASWVGDPTYKQLSKDLANVQISNIKAVGGSLDTVGGQSLIRMASGDETFPPEVLLSIARRADADITNLDMMATGLQRHAQRYGDANAKRFQQMWASNADSRIFEIMNIARDVKDPAKRKEMTDKLLGDMDEAQRQDLFRRYNNLVKLTKTGDL